jgi:hypothetical protein
MRKSEITCGRMMKKLCLIKMDTYSLAMLREELGVPSDRDLNVYHGLKIVVDADTDNEIVRVIGVEQLT